jgi:hypothetical protein
VYDWAGNAGWKANRLAKHRPELLRRNEVYRLIGNEWMSGDSETMCLTVM